MGCFRGLIYHEYIIDEEGDVQLMPKDAPIQSEVPRVVFSEDVLPRRISVNLVLIGVRNMPDSRHNPH